MANETMIENLSYRTRLRALRFVGAVCAAGGLWISSLQFAHAEPPVLSVPIDCEVGANCWIANYFDADPTEAAAEYTGGFRTYNGHGGVDFAIRDVAAMEQGVPVLASAPGVVRALRDGMQDVNVREIGRAAVEDRECGNGVLVTHADGWSTQYCHLRKASIRVKKGQAMAAGDVLGLVGQSGLAEFPHVHLTVRNPQGEKVDPFTTPGRGDPAAPTLWSSDVAAKLAYRPTDIFALGFRDSVPDGAGVKLGLIGETAVTRSSPALLFWAGMFGVRAGDRYELTLLAPDGKVIARTEKQFEKNQARRFAWIGKRLRSGAWPAGRYVGRIEITHVADGSIQQISRERISEIR